MYTKYGILMNDWLCLTDYCCKGHWCPEATPSCDSYPCHAGSYNNVTGIPAWEQCVDCPEGQYCPQASEVPTDCPAGTFRCEFIRYPQS